MTSVDVPGTKKEEGGLQMGSSCFHVSLKKMIAARSFPRPSLGAQTRFSFDLGASSQNQGAAPEEWGGQMIQLAVRGMLWTKRVILVPAENVSRVLGERNLFSRCVWNLARRTGPGPGPLSWSECLLC